MDGVRATVTDDSFYFDCGQFLPDGVGIVAPVGKQGLDLVDDHAEQQPKTLNVVTLARRQHKPEGAALCVASVVEFGAETASRSAKSLGFLSPFLSRLHNDVPGPRCYRSCRR